MSDKRIKILLVEDEAAHAEVIRRVLEGQNKKFRVILETSIAGYKAAIKLGAPDIILTDFRLPDGSAFDIINREHTEISCPIIVMTAFGDEKTAVKVIQAGADDYIVKSEAEFKNLPWNIERILRDWQNKKEREHAERALKESEERFRILIENSPIPIIFTRVGMLEYTNEAFRAMMGINPDEKLKGRNFLDFIHPDSREQIHSYILARAKHEYAPLIYETTGLRSNGEAFPFEVNVVSITLEDQEYVLAYIHDLTERKKNEENIKESEKRLNQIINFLPDATLAIDNHGVVIAWNKEMEKITGVPAEDMIGKGDYEYAIPFYGEKRPLLIDLVFKSNEDARKTYSFVRFEGDTLIAETNFAKPRGRNPWLWVKAVPIYDIHGNKIGGIESIRDITMIKKAEEYLRESEERYRATVDSLEDFINVVDRDYNIVLCNNAFIRNIRNFGITEDPVGKNLFDLLKFLPGDTKDRYRNVFEKGQVDFNEEHDVLENYETWVEVSRVPLFDKTGQVVRVVTIVHDITQRKESEEVIKDTLNALSRSQQIGKIGSWLLHLDNMRFSASQVALELYGLPKDSIPTFEQVAEQVHPDDRIKARDAMQTALKTGKPYIVQIRIFRADNKEMRYIISRGEVEKNAGGKPAALFGINQDITDLKIAEQAFLESEARFSRLAENAPDVIYRMSIPDGVYEYINPSAEKVLGYSQKDFYENPKLIEKIIHPEWRGYLQQQWKNMLDGDIPASFEYKIALKDGGEKWLFQRNIVVRDEKGKPVALEGIVSDITERKNAEEELRESEARNKAFLNANPDMMFVFSENGQIIDYKGEMRGDLYAPPEAFLGKNILDVLPEDIAKETIKKIKRIKETGEMEIHEYSLEIGETQYFESRLVPYGKDKYVAIVRNITDRKLAEENRLEMERKMLHVQKLESLGVLAGGIAHDFNNILMAVLGHADLALNSLPPMSPAKESLLEIEKAARRASDLSRQMLAYSGKGKFLIEVINISDLVTEMAHLLKASISKKAILNLNMEKNLPGIEGDATQIRQILMNLITNASEAIGDQSGVITISTGVMEYSKDSLAGYSLDENLNDGNYVFFEVSDTGVGMAKETLSRIFEPFFTTKFTGRGLGMAAVMGIVRGHKGAIKIYSEPGTGSTFKVLFPAVDKQPEGNHVSKTGQPEKWSGTGKVMLVDDEESIIILGRKMLEKAGFDVLTASNGEEALSLYRENMGNIRFVLLDLTMPRMDGEETFRELRTIDPDARVVMSSGYTEQEIVPRFAGKGLAGFIQKPFSMKELIDITRKVLSEK